MVPITTVLCVAEEAGFEIRDLECLREHYTLTSRQWTRNLEAHAAEAIAATSEEVYRTWRVLLSGLAYTCEIGRNTVYQALLVKPNTDGRSHLPLTRTGWYQ
jgi:cyclopropane-fatty-acyl-phospholipid synthase